jgi:hypothetical protein
LREEERTMTTETAYAAEILALLAGGKATSAPQPQSRVLPPDSRAAAEEIYAQADSRHLVATGRGVSYLRDGEVHIATPTAGDMDEWTAKHHLAAVRRELKRMHWAEWRDYAARQAGGAS